MDLKQENPTSKAFWSYLASDFNPKGKKEKNTLDLVKFLMLEKKYCPSTMNNTVTLVLMHAYWAHKSNTITSKVEQTKVIHKIHANNPRKILLLSHLLQQKL